MQGNAQLFRKQFNTFPKFGNGFKPTHEARAEASLNEDEGICSPDGEIKELKIKEIKGEMFGGLGFYWYFCGVNIRIRRY